MFNNKHIGDRFMELSLNNAILLKFEFSIDI